MSLTDQQRTETAADNCEVLRARLARYEDADGKPITTIAEQAREIERLNSDYNEACEDAMCVARELERQKMNCLNLLQQLEDLKAQPSGVVLHDLRELLGVLLLDDDRRIKHAGTWRQDLHERATTMLARLNQPASGGVSLSGSRVGRVYVAGPMTGYENYNFAAFNAEAERLRADGLHVENPADHGVVDGADWADYLRYDIARLSTCERIHLLPGWSKSKGAQFEVHIAHALGMKIQYAEGAETASAGDDAERAAFEAAVRRHHQGDMRHLESRTDEGYYVHHIQELWLIWQARAALSAPSYAQDAGEVVAYWSDFSMVSVRFGDRVRTYVESCAPSHGEQVREGWQLVPVEPTDAMLEAGDKYIGTPATYKSMLSACPSPAITKDFSQFLSAVMDAAGLIRHGRQSKELSEYLGMKCMEYRGAALSAPSHGEQVRDGWAVSLMGPDEVVRIQRKDGKWCGVTHLSESPRDRLLYEFLRTIAAPSAGSQGGDV